ncbi:MAG: nucleotidyltransferase family protein [Limisphaerales bacterium]
MSAHPFGVVILAAGASRRMGSPKLLLPWGDQTVVAHIIATWRELGALHIAPVCRHDDEALAAELSHLDIPAADRILNSAPDAEMFSSIRCAAAWDDWNPEVTHFVIALGDQPQIRNETLSTLLLFANDHPHSICQPTFQDRPKHPVIIPARIFRDLVLSPATTLREFLESHTAHRCYLQTSDESLNVDLDTPQAYATARQRFAPLTP